MMAHDNCMCPGFPQVSNPPQYICTEVHVVAAGDTLYSISQEYNVSVPILMQVNKILNPYNLLIGQKICIPGVKPEMPPPNPNPGPPAAPGPGPNPFPTPTPTPTPPAPMPTPPMPTPPMPPGACPEPFPPTAPGPGPNPVPLPTPDKPPQCNGIIHEVKAGDTLYMIAKMHKVTLDSIMAANPNLDPYNLRIGMKICVPTNPNMGGRCPGGMIYNTQKGDTLARILDRFGVTYEALKKANPGVDFCESLETLALCIPM